MTSAADRVGAGLQPARPARPIRAAERIHVVGAAGAGASAAALLALHAGATVSGCDPGGSSPYTPALEALGIEIAPEHAAAHVTSGRRPDRLAVTKALTAIDPDQPELVAARLAGIPLEPWQQVVADAAFGRTLVGVAGTHGKSTTSGWLVHLLVAAGADPSAFVGALLPAAITGGPPATARWGRGDAFVVEADEYAGNFDAYRPGVVVLTSLEWDHPDVFADLEAVSTSFERWIRATAEDERWPVLVANVGDPNVAALVHRLRVDWPGNLVLTAVVDAAPQRLDGYARGLAGEFEGVEPAHVVLGRVVRTEPDGTTVELSGRTLVGEPLTLKVPTAGRHNVANALGAFGAARALDVPADVAAAGLATFPGIGRRLERKGEAAGVVVYDDYGHHPTAIRETIAAVRQREPGRRIWAVYEPLTFHRTAAMLAQFSDVLSAADAVAIADVWAGRDPDTTIVSAADLAAAIAVRRPGLPVIAPGSVEATADALAREVRPGDVVLVMGGGASYRIGERLLVRLEEDR
ncbi:MAG: cyanophycin synthetase [Chloroflexota bacterium]